MRIGIIGANGRMGKTLIEVAEEEGIEIGALIEKEGIEGDYKGKKFESDLRKLCEEVDVFLEFTTPSATLENTLKLIETPKPYVVGTTALDDRHFEKFKELSEKVTVFYSPNMSLGIHLITGFFKKFSEILKNYEIEIMEIHHTGKRDAPSGTALYLFREWKENVNKDVYPIRVYSRKVFARGALFVAKKILNFKEVF